MQPLPLRLLPKLKESGCTDYGLQPEEAPALPNLRAEACPRRTYKMAWFDEEFQTSRGEFIR